MSDLVVCVDVGSTFTKAALVDTVDGALRGTAAVPTTLATDVLEGVDACVEQLGAVGCPVLACSSAGGGLRLAVVGYERVVTAEAGFRVGLSAGARVMHVSAGQLNSAAVEDLAAARPDVILLVGGTDGGNSTVLLHNARNLATSRLEVPVVAAGNADAAEEVLELFASRRKPVVATANVLPDIGVLEPRPAREAIREVFVRHVIGGKRLSKGPRFGRLVRAATPDVVLTGVELLADGAGDVAGVGDVLVVDVGGATTDVYSVVTPEGEDAALRRDVVQTLWRSRTVEGDLGMRWSAPGVVEAALAERLLGGEEAATLRSAADRLAADPAYVPATDEDRAVDVRIAELAVTVALRRHGRPPADGASSKDLRQVRLVVGSGGALRHGDAALRAHVLRPATRDHGGGWKVPEGAATAVDASYVLAAAGLLAGEHPEAAARLVTTQLEPCDA